MGEAKRRLTNIRVKELSIVDEGANNRRFIVVKNKGNGMGAKKINPFKNDNDDNVVQKMSEKIKKGLIDQSNLSIERIKKAIEEVEKVETSDDAGDDVPEDVIKSFENVLEALPSIEGDDEPAEDFGLAKVADEIKKAGKKVSSGRLKKISEAATILTKLLEELGVNIGGSEDAATSKSNSHDNGGGDMTTQKKAERSPEVALTLAEADVIKARDALTEAEESADEAALKKAKDGLVEAEAELKKAKEVKAEADKKAEIEKAAKEKEEADAKLRKAKGEPDVPESFKETFAAIQKGQETINAELKKSREENAELRKKLEEVSKTAVPSNSQDTDGADAAGSGDGDTQVDKAKDPKFWAGVF